MRVYNIIKQAIISLTNSDSKEYPYAQVTYNGKSKNAVLLSFYGYSYNPPTNSHALCFSSLGQESTMFSIANNYSQRFKELEEGEVKIGNPSADTSIYFQNSGNIALQAPTVYIGSSSISLLENISIALEEISKALEQIGTVATFPTAVGPTGTMLAPASTNIAASKAIIDSVKSDVDSITGSI